MAITSDKCISLIHLSIFSIKLFNSTVLCQNNVLPHLIFSTNLHEYLDVHILYVAVCVRSGPMVYSKAQLDKKQRYIGLDELVCQIQIIQFATIS